MLADLMGDERQNAGGQHKCQPAAEPATVGWGSLVEGSHVR